MARIRSLITTALTPKRAAADNDGVHFHSGPNGPYVCEYARCDSPGMDPTSGV